jgi:GT2 family glycosyltransferase
MRLLIPGLKHWPIHHAWEHLVAEALRAAGHEVLFLGCSPGVQEACECVDRAVHARAGGHAPFCAGCSRQQCGVHRQAGFAELRLETDPAVEAAVAARLAGLDSVELLALDCGGVPLGDILTPSLMRWSRSGRSVAHTVPPAVLHEHARTALRLERQLPPLLEREGIGGVFLLNGLFLAERVIADCARRAGLRVVNYERGHVRNTFVLSDGAPACFLGLEGLPLAQPAADGLLDAYLEGRAENRDASTRFGTGREPGEFGVPGRPLAAIFSNVCWDSSVSTRPSGFGGYLDWLAAVLELAAARPQVDFILRIHPGEATLEHDPTLDRTSDWLAGRGLPANLRILAPEDPASSYALMEAAAAGIVFVTSAGLEMACLGKPVIVCAAAHYAGQGFTLEAASPEDLSAALDTALAEDAPDSSRREAARAYADRLFFDAPLPFPWVDEVEYGRPQRLAAPVTAADLAGDALLRSLVEYIVGERPRPISLRQLLAEPSLCPLPFRFASRPGVGEERLGVILPACGRPEALRRALAAWERQDLQPGRIGLLIVDDGSQPPLAEQLGEAGQRPWIRWLRLPENGGPARARNRGIEAFLADGNPPQALLFTGDDIEPEETFASGLLRERRAWADARVAILGRADWPEDEPQTRTMRLVQRNGMQFGYAGLPRRAMLPAPYFYTCAVAVDTGWLAASGLRFDEGFPYAAWEDTEFAVRAMAQGLLLAYDADLRVRHRHPMDYASFARRQRRAGASARVFQRRHPVEHRRICGEAPAAPPDRHLLARLEQALQELSKLDLRALQGLPGQGGDLAAQLDAEQDRLLESLFRLHAEAGWFERPVLELGEGQAGLLSVLIPVHDGWELTEACLRALHEHTAGPWEAVICDNGSRDGTARRLAHWPGVRVLRQKANLGFARGTNLAAAASRGQWLVLLNNDTEVRSGWDLPLREELAEPTVGAVGLRLLYPDGTIQHAGLAFGPDGLPWHLYRGFPGEAPEAGRRREFAALTGACLALRREVYEVFNGLDENFLNCYEDVDLCLRLREAGLSVVYRPDGVVIHHEGRTAGRRDGVEHSWRTLLERWADRLPCDEERLLAEDGWQARREAGGLRLVPLPSRRPAGEVLAAGRRLREQGRVPELRALLEDALTGRPAGSAARRSLLRELFDLELATGNLPALERLESELAGDMPRLQALADLRRAVGERLASLTTCRTSDAAGMCAHGAAGLFTASGSRPGRGAVGEQPCASRSVPLPGSDAGGDPGSEAEAHPGPRAGHPVAARRGDPLQESGEQAAPRGG